MNVHMGERNNNGEVLEDGSGMQPMHRRTQNFVSPEMMPAENGLVSSPVKGEEKKKQQARLSSSAKSARRVQSGKSRIPAGVMHSRHRNHPPTSDSPAPLFKAPSS